MSESEAASNETYVGAHKVLQTGASEHKSPENSPERFNIFEVIDLVRWETVHSRYLECISKPPLECLRPTNTEPK